MTVTTLLEVICGRDTGIIIDVAVDMNIVHDPGTPWSPYDGGASPATTTLKRVEFDAGLAEVAYRDARMDLEAEERGPIPDDLPGSLREWVEAAAERWMGDNP